MKLRIEMGIRGNGNGGGGGDAWAWRRARLDVRSRVRFRFLVLGALHVRLRGFNDRRTRFLLGDGRRRRRRDIRKAFYRRGRSTLCYGGRRKRFEEAEGVKEQEEKCEASPYHEEREQNDTTVRATGHAERLFPDGRRCLGCLGRHLCRGSGAA
jgi:hypothetical protein